MRVLNTSSKTMVSIVNASDKVFDYLLGSTGSKNHVSACNQSTCLRYAIGVNRLVQKLSKVTT